MFQKLKLLLPRPLLWIIVRNLRFLTIIQSNGRGIVRNRRLFTIIIDKRNLRLIKGPPGTGKTSVVVSFLSVITCLDYRTLVCASGNRAICEVAQRFVYLVNQMPSPEKSFQYYAFFHTYGCVGTCKFLQMGDIVLVDNDERLEVESTLSMIYLPLRVKRLSDTVSHSRFWRQSLQNVEKTLKNPHSLFEARDPAGRACVQNSGNSGNFQSLVIDEASQMPGLQQAVLVGDEKQLQSTVLSLMASDSGYGRSLFERLQIVQHPHQLLRTQYRMHPEISSFPNREFYGGVLYFLVKKLQRVCEDHGIRRTSVRIITPYSSQVDPLSRKLCEGDENSLKQFPNLRVEIKTIDGFQCAERGVVLFSTVRANREGKIGFLTEYGRLNVALRRAK
ncbi:hypothetical protein R1sor_008456 [Riccia sorocarpa]|uniref:DNA2/NAM7 helicase-like C-terminal domain-containing protein n=1 Tax=Riccia sorocarpa TaxID=122646 RepID=A0ABD3HXH9_9MARC